MGSFNLFPEYNFSFPQELVANQPVEPRDSARLMVVDTKTKKITFDNFYNLPEYLSPRDLLVFNNTKVVPARIVLVRGDDHIEALFLLNEYTDDARVPVIVNMHMVKGDTLVCEDVVFTVVDQAENVFYLEPSCTRNDLFGLLEKNGTTPVPKYIQNIELSEQELRGRYQTIFAEKPSSVAAPTASLHFTKRVFESLAREGVEHTFVTLHVGLGTFMPITPDNVSSGKLHLEPFSISKESAERIQKHKGSVVAVGTTAVRTLESAKNDIARGSGTTSATELFIRPLYDFHVVDTLITNFHVPQSSLMCLVDAFLQYKKAPWSVVELYEMAIRERMRLFSFGDAMIIL
jgi:S-adenosylmethionine:tRNA ribosyltransferase-isomerase